MSNGSEPAAITIHQAEEALGKIRTKFETTDDRLAVITPDLYGQVFDVMKNAYAKDEPLHQAFDVLWDSNYEQLTLKQLTTNVSICMLSESNNEVTGVRIMAPSRKSDAVSNFTDMTSLPLREMFRYVALSDERLDFYSRMGVDEYIYFFALGVRSAYRGRGVGRRLVQASLALSKELGYKAVRVDASSNFSQRIFERESFEALLDMPFNEYKLSSGELISEKTGIHKNMIVYGKQLL